MRNELSPQLTIKVKANGSVYEFDVDPTYGADTIYEEILARCPEGTTEEDLKNNFGEGNLWWIEDFYDANDLDIWKIKPGTPPEELLDEIQEIAELLEKYGYAAAVHLAENGLDADDTFFAMRDTYRGYWHSFKKYAESFADDVEDIPDHLQSYINWDRYADDLEADYHVLEDPRGGVHVWIA